MFKIKNTLLFIVSTYRVAVSRVKVWNIALTVSEY